MKSSPNSTSVNTQLIGHQASGDNSSNYPQISIVVPLYNEVETFTHLTDRLNQIIDSINLSVEVVLIDDGSSDGTTELMYQLALENERYQCIFLSRNHGHQIALTAGLAAVTATEAVMIIDGDLQDPPELLPEMYNAYKEGNEVVYAVRKKRKESGFKKLSYYLFYRLLKSISYINIPLDSGDFALISRRVVNILNKMPEESRFIRGMRSWIGFRQIGIEYERHERFAGQPKYSIKRLIRLAHNGIFNFSEFPIKLITNLGIMTISISLIYLVITLINKIFYNDVPRGFTALLFTIILFSGVQLISLGVIGEYVLRIFFQVKNRPLFIVKNRVYKKEVFNE